MRVSASKRAADEGKPLAIFAMKLQAEDEYDESFLMGVADDVNAFLQLKAERAADKTEGSTPGPLRQPTHAEWCVSDPLTPDEVTRLRAMLMRSESADLERKAASAGGDSDDLNPPPIV